MPQQRRHPPRLGPMPARRSGGALARARVAASAGALAVLTLATAPFAVADDTEVFFAGERGDGAAATNVLFVLPSGRSMGCAFGATERCEVAIEDGTARMDVVKAALGKVLDTLADSGTSVG